VTAVASFAPKFQHFHSCHYAAQHPTHKSIFPNASELQYSLTADDWHTAAQLHPLNNLGVGDDDEMSSFMMMGDGSSNGAAVGVGNRGGAAMSASHHSTATATAVTGDDDMVKEIMEAFLPVILLILLEIYSQQILQFPLA